MIKKIFILLVLFNSICSFSQSLKKTQVLILGTPHLNQIEHFQPSYLKRVLDSLESKEFDAIAIEKMPVELLFDIKHRKKEYWQDLYQVFNQYIEFGMSHQKRLNIYFEQAEKRIKELQLKTTLSEQERVDYINSFICTYDIWSAILHYKQLTDKNQLSSEVVEVLNNLSSSNNEVNTLALEVAKTNQLNQIYYIDNLQDETILINEFPKFIAEYQENKEMINELIHQSPIYQKIDSIQKESIKQKDMYSLYQFFNSNEYKVNDFETQWALWFKTHFKSKTDRSRYALWEMRNLSISANILRVIASNPEKKILVIIGASHKSFIEKYLKQIQDIEILDF